MALVSGVRSVDIFSDLKPQTFETGCRQMDEKTWLMASRNLSSGEPLENLFFQTNETESMKAVMSDDGYISTLQFAYNRHYDLVLSPDDLNLHVLQNVQKLVKKDPERFRDIFVSHQGQEEITCWDDQTQFEWNAFFANMTTALRKRVKSNITNLMCNDFSCSTPLEQVVTQATLMNVLEKYFTYGRGIRMCGIPRVHFLGTLEDWLKLQAHFRLLRDTFNGDDLVGRVGLYYESVLSVLEKWIETYQGSPDLEWWDKMMDSQLGRLGSSRSLFFSGWICKLSIHYFDQTNIPWLLTTGAARSLDVDVTNMQLMQKYKVQVFSGWYGIGVDTERSRVRPLMAIGVYKRLETVEFMRKEKE